MEGADLRVTLSVEEQRSALRDTASHRVEVEVDASDASKNWDFKMMMDVDEGKASGVHVKFEEAQRLC